MVGTEINVLIAVIAQRVVHIHLPNRFRQRSIHIIERFALVGRIDALAHRSRQCDIHAGRDNHIVYIRLAGQLGCSLVDSCGVHIRRTLAEIVILIRRITSNQNGAQRLHGNIGHIRLFNLMRWFLFPVGRKIGFFSPGRFLRGGVVRRRRDRLIGNLIALPHFAVYRSAGGRQQRLKLAVQRHIYVPERKGVGKPGIDIVKIIARGQRCPAERGKLRQITLLRLRSFRVQRNDPGYHGKQKQRGKKHADLYAAIASHPLFRLLLHLRPFPSDIGGTILFSHNRLSSDQNFRYRNGL